MKIFGFEIKIKRLRKETDKEIRDRIRTLCKTDDLCNHSEDTMSAQAALNELCDYFLVRIGMWLIHCQTSKSIRL